MTKPTFEDFAAIFQLAELTHQVSEPVFVSSDIIPHHTSMTSSDASRGGRLRDLKQTTWNFSERSPSPISNMIEASSREVIEIPSKVVKLRYRNPPGQSPSTHNAPSVNDQDKVRSTQQHPVLACNIDEASTPASLVAVNNLTSFRTLEWRDDATGTCEAQASIDTITLSLPSSIHSRRGAEDSDTDSDISVRTIHHGSTAIAPAQQSDLMEPSRVWFRRNAVSHALSGANTPDSKRTSVPRINTDAELGGAHYGLSKGFGDAVGSMGSAVVQHSDDQDDVWEERGWGLDANENLTERSSSHKTIKSTRGMGFVRLKRSAKVAGRGKRKASLKPLSATRTAVDFRNRRQLQLWYQERLSSLIPPNIKQEVEVEGGITPIGRLWKAAVRYLESLKAPGVGFMDAGAGLSDSATRRGTISRDRAMLEIRDNIEGLKAENEKLRTWVANVRKAAAGDIL